MAPIFHHITPTFLIISLISVLLLALFSFISLSIFVLFLQSLVLILLTWFFFLVFLLCFDIRVLLRSTDWLRSWPLMFANHWSDHFWVIAPLGSNKLQKPEWVVSFFLAFVHSVLFFCSFVPKFELLNGVIARSYHSTSFDIEFRDVYRVSHTHSARPQTLLFQIKIGCLVFNFRARKTTEKEKDH